MPPCGRYRCTFGSYAPLHRKQKSRAYRSKRSLVNTDTAPAITRSIVAPPLLHYHDYHDYHGS